MRPLKIILLALILFMCVGCKEQIIHGLSEPEANKLLTRLHEVNINSEKVRQADGKWTISVASADALPAIRYLDQSRLFRDKSSQPKERSGLVSSREDQRFTFERALSREIEQTLYSMEGVLDARVHLNLPVRDPLFGRRIKDGAPGSGSVLLVAGESFSFSKEDVGEMVGSAAGVNSSRISVLINISENSDFKMLEEFQPQLARNVPTTFLTSRHITVVSSGVLGFAILVILHGTLRRRKVKKNFRELVGEKSERV